MTEEAAYKRERERMVREQLVSRDIRDERVLEAMRQVPRHLFVTPENRHLAYADGPLPIGSGQTISQPYIVALMSQLLKLEGDETVLEIGTGSGYQSAVLSHLAADVHTIELHESLAKKAQASLEELGLTNVHVHIGDGSKGWPEAAPYEGIIVTAAAPQVPRPLFDQLDEGGRLVVPVGSRGGQYLERWTRQDADYKREQIAPVAFVPLFGEHGWEGTEL
ncbi:MAG TPA: protein-L-isoaspartate(D-aspartate) O-methyltransferase [Anaerolineales bacterium]